MGRGAITIKAQPRGATSLLKRFVSAGSALPGETLESQRELGRRAEVAFAAHVPVRSGREMRGIASLVLGGDVIVKDEARNPTSAYDYVGVTRFGHKAARIYPKHRGHAMVVDTQRKLHGEALTDGENIFVVGRPALRFSIGGRVMYRTSVAGYHPDHDWAEEALPEVRSEAQAVATRLGQKIVARF